MTKIINLFAGPGAGKSTTASGVFHDMKLKGYKVELILEYAKDLTYEDRVAALKVQPYIFGKQLMRLMRVYDKVDFIITDSPLALSCHYGKKWPKSFTKSCLEIFHQFYNINFFLERIKPYVKLGRTQSEEGARKIDEEIFWFLKRNRIQFVETVADELAHRRIIGNICL